MEEFLAETDDNMHASSFLFFPSNLLFSSTQTNLNKRAIWWLLTVISPSVFLLEKELAFSSQTHLKSTYPFTPEGASGEVANRAGFEGWLMAPFAFFASGSLP